MVFWPYVPIAASWKGLPRWVGEVVMTTKKSRWGVTSSIYSLRLEKLFKIIFCEGNRWENRMYCLYIRIVIYIYASPSAFQGWYLSNMYNRYVYIFIYIHILILYGYMYIYIYLTYVHLYTLILYTIYSYIFLRARWVGFFSCLLSWDSQLGPGYRRNSSSIE